MNNIATITEQTHDGQFYPTPPELIARILEGVDFSQVHTVLEPSAGKGDIAKAIIEKAGTIYRSRERIIDIDCIELDRNLQHILKGNNLRLVHDDFLTYNALKTYDLIIMNPPFACGAEHLLYALHTQRNGGDIICILNAETLKNPCHSVRRQLSQQLEKHGAKVEYISDAFSKAERKTGVEVAIVKVSIPKARHRCDIYDKLKAAQQEEEPEVSTSKIAVADYMAQIVRQCELEARAGIELIQQFNAMKPYMLRSFDASSGAHDTILRLTASSDRGYSDVSVNEFLEKVRAKYWKALFQNPKFTKQLTSELRDKYGQKVDELKDYDFSEFNISTVVAQMNGELKAGVEDTITKMFDRLTLEHSWYKECLNNRHYYDGWAHNKAHKINKKVIIPCCQVFDTGRWGNGNFRAYKALDVLQDIEKVLNYLDGHMSEDVNLCAQIDKAIDGKNIECKFFDVNFYKKGTCHITFTNMELLDKFNIYASLKKAWLPPNYGKKKYSDLSREEKAIVDDFQGEPAYNKVMANKAYYLAENANNLLMLGE